MVQLPAVEAAEVGAVRAGELELCVPDGECEWLGSGELGAGRVDPEDRPSFPVDGGGDWWEVVEPLEFLVQLDGEVVELVVGVGGMFPAELLEQVEGGRGGG